MRIKTKDDGVRNMKKNTGKVFEDDFKKSIPEWCLLQRLNDAPQAFSMSNLTRFTHKQPCDFILFDTDGRVLYFLELKTTKSKSITFEDINSEEKQNKMIHKHQIEGLLERSKYPHVCCGFLFNFRDEESGIERTYFQDIESFVDMAKRIGKKSFNETDMTIYKSKKVYGDKKISRYRWDIASLMRSMND